MENLAAISLDDHWQIPLSLSFSPFFFISFHFLSLPLPPFFREAFELAAFREFAFFFFFFFFLFFFFRTSFFPRCKGCRELAKSSGGDIAELISLGTLFAALLLLLLPPALLFPLFTGVPSRKTTIPLRATALSKDSRET